VGTGPAELDTTTTAPAAGTVAAVVDGHVRGLAPGVVRDWTVTGGTAGPALRVVTVVREVLPDGTETVDDAESYAQLLGVGEALRAAGFVVEEVLDGWRTVALDVAAAAAGPDKPKKAKAKKVKPPKPPKPPKPAKPATSGKAPKKAAAADEPKKSLGGLLRRRPAPKSDAATDTDAELASAAA
jgi:hypothetical protein